MSTGSENTLTPYDTGKRAEPKPWAVVTGETLAALAPIDRSLNEDRFGRVDFDDDESITLVTIWVEKNAAGEHVVHIQPHAVDEVTVKVHG